MSNVGVLMGFWFFGFGCGFFVALWAIWPLLKQRQ